MHTFQLPFTTSILALLAIQAQVKGQEATSSFCNDYGTTYGDYFISDAASTWVNALTDCQHWGILNDFKAGLLSVQSAEELEHVKELILHHTPSEGYWTDGSWSTPKHQWQWASLKTPVNMELLQGRYNPSISNTQLSKFSRLFYTVSRDEDAFSFDNDSNPRKYVCKRLGDVN